MSAIHMGFLVRLMYGKVLWGGLTPPPATALVLGLTPTRPESRAAAALLGGGHPAEQLPAAAAAGGG